MAEMQIYKVKAPDGTIVKVQGPAGASQEDIISNAKRLFSQQSAIQPTSNMGVGSARALGQGLTLGFGEEIEAGLRSAASATPGFGEVGLAAGIPTEPKQGDIYDQMGLRTQEVSPEFRPYKDIRDEIRTSQAQFSSENPLLSTGLELGGALALPFGLGVAGRLPKTLDTALRSGSVAQRAKAGAAVGGGAGAITGAGVAPELEDVPSYAAGYGAGGAALSVAGGEAIRAGAKLTGDAFRNITERLGFGDVNKRATEIITDRLSADELSPNQVKDIFEEYKKLGVDDATLADLGKNLQDLGYQSYVVPGAGKTGVKEFLEKRTTELPDETVQGLTQKAKVKSDVFGYDYVKQLSNNQRAAANKAYPEAYTKAIPAEPFRKFADRKVFLDAYDEAVKKADVYGETLPSFDQIQNADFVPTELLHQIKIGLDRVVNKHQDKITGKIDDYGRDVLTVKNEFNDLIKQYNKPYAQANARFADEARIRDAYEMGLKYNKLTTSELADKVGKLNPAEKESFRVGLLSNVKEELSKFKSGDFQRRIFASDKQKQALLRAFDNTKDYQDFVRQLELQADKLATERRVLKGSQTYENIATADQELLTPEVLTEAARGNIGRALGGLVSEGGARLKYPPRTAEAVRRKLFETDPAKRQLTLDEIETLLKPKKNRLPAGIFPYVSGTSGLLGSE